jgi:hypothetical protein
MNVHMIMLTFAIKKLRDEKVQNSPKLSMTVITSVSSTSSLTDDVKGIAAAAAISKNSTTSSDASAALSCSP